MGLRDILRDAGLSGYAEVALVLFFFAFVLIVLWVLHRRRSRDWDQAGQLPLEDDRVLMPRGGRDEVPAAGAHERPQESA